MLRLAALLLAVGVLSSCATGVATFQPGSPAATSTRTALPSQSPSWYGTPVPTQVLAPATVPPVVGLCTYGVHETADGNFEPRFCSDGSINVDAWRLYASFAPHILGAGKDATVGQIDAALRADFDGHATNVETIDSYQLAAAYYGWTFSPNPACELTYQTATCY